MTPRRRAISSSESAAASRSWWDQHADDYQHDHGEFLGDARWIWGPEGLDEADAGLLGTLADQQLLELGCGAASGARWAQQQGASVVGLDLSLRQLQHSRRIDDQLATDTVIVCADSSALPFASGTFDVVGSAYGALPFVADVDGALREVARVLRPGGRWVFSVTHPIRWAFPDVPGSAGLTVNRSYFDRASYVEEDDEGQATYVEHHRTVGDWVTHNVRAGFIIEQLVEPEWPMDLSTEWGGWSRTRGMVIPGTLIVVCQKSR
jgi:SAM-dependent methyltransferase